MKKTSLHNYLAITRQASGLSQMEVAKRLGFDSSQFISNVERGISLPPLGKLRKYVKTIKADENVVYFYMLDVYSKKIQGALSGGK